MRVPKPGDVIKLTIRRGDSNPNQLHEAIERYGTSLVVMRVDSQSRYADIETKGYHGIAVTII